jgi:hypothetical protein
VSNPPSGYSSSSDGAREPQDEESDVQTGAEAGASEGTTDDALLNEAPDESDPTGGADDGLGGLTDQPGGDEPEDASMLNSACDALRPLDAREVYILGTVAQGSAGAGALAHWRDPNTALVGFGYYTDVDDGFIDPLDGTLVFSESAAAFYRFREDACRNEDTRATLPTDPLANDDVISFPCSRQISKTNRVLSSLNGLLALSCGTDWFDEAGRVLFGGEPQALEFDGEHFLTSDGIYDIASAELVPFNGLPNFVPLTSRVLESGFWLVLPGEAAMNEPGLWLIGEDGTVELMGLYPAPPTGTILESEFQGGSVVSAQGELFSIAGDSAEPTRDLIVRRTLDGTSQVVYDEINDPVVKLHSSDLVTGP